MGYGYGDEDDEIAAFNPPNPYLKQTPAIEPPSLIRARAILGPEKPLRADCYLCKAARVDSGATACRFWVDMTHMYRQDRVDTDSCVSALNRAKKFAVMAKKANKNLEPGQEPIPILSPMEIWWHDKFHLKDASSRIENTIERYQEIEDTIEGQMYVMQRDAAGRIRPAVDLACIKPLIEVTKEKRAFMQLRAREMHLYATDYDVNVATVTPWANMRRPVYVANMPDVTKRHKAKRVKT